MSSQSSLRRGLSFGAATAALGAALWGGMGAAGTMPLGEVIKLSLVAAGFWGAVGMIVGAFGPRKVPMPFEETPHSRLHSVLLLAGRVAYRIAVGFMVAMIGCNGVMLSVYLLGDMSNTQKIGSKSPTFGAGLMMCGLAGASVGGFTGALLGALLAPMGFGGQRATRTLPTSIRAWAVGTGIGFGYGMICGVVVARPLSSFTLALLSGVGAGLGGGLFG